MGAPAGPGLAVDTVLTGEAAHLEAHALVAAGHHVVHAGQVGVLDGILAGAHRRLLRLRNNMRGGLRLSGRAAGRCKAAVAEGRWDASTCLQQPEQGLGRRGVAHRGGLAVLVAPYAHLHRQHLRTARDIVAGAQSLPAQSAPTQRQERSMLAPVSSPLASYTLCGCLRKGRLRCQPGKPAPWWSSSRPCCASGAAGACRVGSDRLLSTALGQLDQGPARRAPLR